MIETVDSGDCEVVAPQPGVRLGILDHRSVMTVVDSGPAVVHTTREVMANRLLHQVLLLRHRCCCCCCWHGPGCWGRGRWFSWVGSWRGNRERIRGWTRAPETGLQIHIAEREGQVNRLIMITP